MRKTIICALSALVLTGCEQKPAPGVPSAVEIPQKSGFSMDDLDTSIPPGDDFWGYTNGLWIDKTEIPPQWPRYGAVLKMVEKTELELRTIIDQISTTDVLTEPGKISTLYHSFMDTEQAEKLGMSPLAGELEKIDALNSLADVTAYFAYGMSIGVQTPLDFFVDAAADDPNRTLAYFWQDGLGLPDRDYYLKDGEKFVTIREQYATHIEEMYAQAGWERSQMAAHKIIAIEHALASSQWTRVQSRDRETIYSNRFTLDEASALSPGFNWNLFLNTAGFDSTQPFIIAQTDYFAGLGDLLQQFSVEDWQFYLRFKLLKAYAPYLNETIVDENFAFQSGVLRGQEEQRERWERGIKLVNKGLGEALGKLYIAENFPESSKQRVQELVENLRESFRISIGKLSWMSDETKTAARDKLAAFNSKIGYPDKWKDYTSLLVEKIDLVGNVKGIHQFDYEDELGKLDKPVDRSEWGMTPQTINAYYRATYNEIVFPAAI
ncbi:MAG: M13 family metallopeptidase, partial [Gammaproteobacteria bacterium]